MAAPITAAVITVSDEVASGADANRSGPVAVEGLAGYGVQAEPVTVGDSVSAIRAAVSDAVAAGHRVVLTCGGTGVGPTDVTVPAVRPLLAHELPGIGEEIRRRGAAHTARALLSREVAGVLLPESGPPVFVVCAPGSRGGVRDALEVVGPLLRTVLDTLDGTPRV